MKRHVLIGLATTAALIGGPLTAIGLTQGEPTVETRTFTHEDVVTFTVPTETVVITETVVSTETVTVTAPTTTPPPPEPDPTAAHLWIDTNGGTCTRASSPADYVDAASCPGLQAAYNAAELGDLVLIRDGVYGDQVWASAAGSKGQPDAILPPVTFRAETEHQVTLGSVVFRVPHVRLEDVIAAGAQARYRPEQPSFEASGNAHFDNLILTKRVMFTAVKNFSLTNSLISGYGADGVDIYGSGSGTADVGHYPQFGLIENTVIRDLGCCDKVGDHIDGIQFNTGLDVTIRNVTLGPNIHHQDMLVQADKGPIANIVIENSEFHDVIDPGFSLMFERRSLRQCAGNVVRFNTFHRGPTPRSGPDDQCTGVMTDNTIASMSAFNCQQWLETWTLARNTFLSGEPCGSP